MDVVDKGCPREFVNLLHEAKFWYIFCGIQHGGPYADSTRERTHDFLMGLFYMRNRIRMKEKTNIFKKISSNA